MGVQEEMNAERDSRHVILVLLYSCSWECLLLSCPCTVDDYILIPDAYRILWMFFFRGRVSAPPPLPFPFLYFHEFMLSCKSIHFASIFFAAINGLSFSIGEVETEGCIEQKPLWQAGWLQ